MIGDDMVISYKTGANFIKYLVKLITYKYVLMELEENNQKNQQKII